MLRRLETGALRAALLAFAGCGGASPEPDPLAFLQVGVDPAMEATSVAEDLERSGFDSIDRRDAERFVLLLARRSRDGACRLRIVSRRGTVFGADSPDPRDPERIGLAIAGDAIADLDGDARPEIAITIERPDRRCVGLVRVTDEGAAAEIPLPLASIGPNACVEAIADVAGDRRVELLAVAHIDVAGLDESATLAWPISGRDGSFAMLDPQAAETFHARARARIERELDDAPAGPARIRLALALAWLTFARGATIDDAVALFDRSVGMPDDPVIERARAALRAREE